jgi:hypothetical protein
MAAAATIAGTGYSVALCLPPNQATSPRARRGALGLPITEHDAEALMRPLFSRFAKPTRRRGVRRREVFAAQFDGGKSAAAYGTTIYLSCDVLERRVVLTSSEGDFIFSQGTITGYKGAGGVVEIPSTIGGVPVAVIGDSAFKGNTTITSVVISDSVVVINGNAFSDMTSLASAKIGRSVAYIGNAAFSGDKALKSVTIGKSVHTIGEYAFQESGLTSVSIPGNVKTIGDGAFWYSDNLTRVVIGRGVQTIGNSAFGYNAALKSVTIPGSVKTIGVSAFVQNEALTSLVIGNGVQTIGDGAFAANTALRSVTIPGSVKTIGYGMFYLNSSLKHLVIGDGVQTIGEGAFADNTALTHVTIPNSVRTIGQAAFRGATSLRTVSMGNQVTSIGEEAFAQTTALKSVTFSAKAPTVVADAFKDVPFGAKAIRAVGLTGYGRNGDIWHGLIVWTPGRVAAPTVSVNAASLAQNIDTCTIKGTGFLAGKPYLHQVTFNNGAVGTVTAATATTLTVKFTKQATSTGPLTAIVTSVGGTSGVAKQVATLVSADSPEVPFAELPTGAGPIDSDAPKSFATTTSGLRYRVLRQGSSAKPNATGTVTVNYQRWPDDGKVIDSNNGISFKLT